MAIAVTLQTFSLTSNRYIVTATLTTPGDNDTWDTGLRVVDAAGFTIVEATGSAADAIGIASIAAGVITLDVQGAVDVARAWAIGV